MGKTICISDASDRLLVCLMEDQNGDYVIVEPADGSIKAEVFNFEPMFRDDEQGNLYVSRDSFIIRG